ncbi:hypothetical protein RHMOL_Rhmol05G0309400 [Rhododendron molle]|uniref:Uncharacterized protein n=1 Tax=Rhododendron molle TaxID=49168 RepID=A0ACC0NX80_RHOML|nr:hypothetical protein RHMOL_Rhmol05G0309400 [Rhododendron molle]
MKVASLLFSQELSTLSKFCINVDFLVNFLLGHREEALAKAEESISIRRSFKAFFLKAYAVADSNLDTESSLFVIQLLEEALRCPSDGLRKGQAKFVPGTTYEASIIFPSIYGILLSMIAGKLHDKRQMSGWKAVSLPVSIYSNSWSLIEWPRNLFHVLMDDHKEAEAISKLSKAISFKPYLQLLHLCAAFHDSMGDYISTRCDCEVALCLDPSHTDSIELYHRA